MERAGVCEGERQKERREPDRQRRERKREAGLMDARKETKGRDGIKKECI